MIYDVILIAIFLIFIIINVFRGAARSLAGFLTALLAYAAATPLGKLLADQAYAAIFRPAIDKAVADSISNFGADAATKVNELLPSWMAGILNLSGADLSNLVTSGFSGAADTASNAVNAAVQPIATQILTFFITIIVFLLLWLILRWLIARPLIRLMRRFTVVRTVDGILGGVIGFIDAFLLVSMLAYLLKLLLPNIASQSGILNESTIYNSFIFYHFYSGNIFTAICSWIGI